MSVKQIGKVWDHSPLRAERLLVHLAIADHMDHDGVGWVSWRQIQAKAKVGRTVVSYTIKELQRLGFLAVETHAKGTRATVYRLIWPSQQEGPLGVQQVNGSPGEPVQVTTSRGSGDDARGSGAAHSSVHYIRPVPPSSVVQQCDDVHVPSLDFDDFWNIAVHKKGGKIAAGKALTKALTQTDPDTLMAAWVEANQSWATWPDKKFIPLPATWLNQGRWTDDAPSPHQSASKALTTAQLAQQMREQEQNDEAFGMLGHHQSSLSIGPTGTTH